MSDFPTELTAVLDDAPAAEPSRRRWSRADTGIVAGFLLFALFVYSGQWLNLGTGYLVNSAQDQNMWEWFFAVTAKAVSHLENPLASDLQNYPLGVNLMANTAMLGVGVPLTPITLLFGPTVTWAIALTGGLAGTAAAWYWVLSRHLVTSRFAAAVGGLFCGFAPPLISHGNAHPNFVGLFVLPFIVLRLVKLVRSERPVRDGVVLGLLLAYQIFLGEEPLLICMLSFVVFAIAYALSRPREVPELVRPTAIGLGVAILVSVALAAFPLWWQFSGPQSYASLEHGPVGNDTAAFTRFPTQSVAGDANVAQDVALNYTEENAFFGWPLIVLVVVISGWLWRVVLARAVAIAMAVMALLSLGVSLIVSHTDTGIILPWKLLSGLPLFESVLESRFAMGCVPAIGILLAMATDRVWRASPRFGEVQADLPVRLLWCGALVAVLLPIAPTPLESGTRPATPAFFADGTWRQFVGQGKSVVTVPLASPGNAKPLRWQVEASLGFPLAEGYFVGPNGPNDKRGRYGAVTTSTSRLLDEVVQTGAAAVIDDRTRAKALRDLRYWRADVLVLGPDEHQVPLKQTVDELLHKPGEFVDGVWVWDVRVLTTGS
ncbi:glycosyl transferase [Amycolatopsis sp. CA-230715]|uniref:glycosyl transferase n=1 Tax=Amycolatopsis sp. CA-230715 TaxID=2745196 RepID=UPI003FA427DF